MIVIKLKAGVDLKNVEWLEGGIKMSKVLRKMLISIVILSALVQFCAVAADAEEEVLEMSVMATVNSDGSVVLTESLIVAVETNILRGGLVRRFQTIFPETDGKYRRTRFEVVSSMVDGGKVSFARGYSGNNIEITVGNSATIMGIGKRRFDMMYNARGWINYGEASDSLTLNLTGESMPYKVSKLNFSITLPGGASVMGRTMKVGDKVLRDSDVSVRPINFIESTKPILPGEGFKVTYSWPKGVVTPPKPPMFEQLSLFIDTLGTSTIMIIVFCSAMLLFVCNVVLMYVRKQASGGGD
jgi:hypothetical protein